MLNRLQPIIIVTANRIERIANVKTLMGKQYNKAEKRKRRDSYNKRKNEAVKAKVKTKKA